MQSVLWIRPWSQLDEPVLKPIRGVSSKSQSLKRSEEPVLEAVRGAGPMPGGYFFCTVLWVSMRICLTFTGSLVVM